MNIGGTYKSDVDQCTKLFFICVDLATVTSQVAQYIFSSVNNSIM